MRTYEENTMLSTFEKIYDQLVIRALSIVRERELALDILQDVALMLVEKQESLSNVDYQEAFLHTCVRNRAIDVLRKNSRSVPVNDAILAHFGVSNEGGITRVENEQWLRTYLKALPAPLSEAFLEHVLDGARIRDIAQALHIPANTLARQFRRIKRKIAHEARPQIRSVRR